MARSDDGTGEVHGPGTPVKPLPPPGARAPRLSSQVILRPRLTARLDADTPLTLVRAPLGFGKTTLAAQWVQGLHDRAVAWVTVESDATEDDRLWEGILEALTDAGLAPDQHARAARAQVRRVLATAAQPVVLVVDAFERVTDEGADHALLDLLRVSHQLQLVVCLRSSRHFQPHTYLDLDSTVITPSELLLTEDETAALLDEIGVGDLSEARVRAVHADAGGWVEPIRAFAIERSRSSTSEPNLPTDQDAATAAAAAYLHQRILPIINEQLVEFALATALVDEISPELAALLADDPDDPDATSHLRHLEASGMLYASADHGETMYHWPAAAQRAMAAELHRRSPDQARAFHARIARWYAARDQPHIALGHAVSAREWPLAVQIIEQHWRPLVVAHRDVLHAALSAAPPDVVATSARALAMRDLRLQAPDDRLLAAIPNLPADPEALRQIGTSDQAAEVLDTGTAMLIALCRRGMFERALDYCTRLESVAAAARVTRTAQVAAHLPGMLARAGLVHLLADDIAGAHRPLVTAFETSGDSPFNYVQREAAGKLAFAHALSGDLPEAYVWLSRHDLAPTEKGWLSRVASSAAVGARILVALDRLDTKKAAAIAATTPVDLGVDEWSPLTAYVRVLVALDTGDALGGLRQLDQARVAYPRWHGAGSTARILLASAEADLLLSLGRPNAARAVLHAAGAGHSRLRVVQARLLLLAGRTEAALAQAGDLGWGRAADTRARLEMLLIKAVAQHRLGHRDAGESLRAALAAAQTSGSCRPFLTVPRAELLALASRLPAESVGPLHHPALRDRPDLFPDHVELIELTDREQTVLALVAEGLLVRQIAERLYVSPSTVKTHMKAVYRKLSATNRDEAVANGRRLGFLTSAPPRIARAG